MPDDITIPGLLARVNDRAYEVDTSTRAALRGLVRANELLLERVEYLENVLGDIIINGGIR